MREVVISISHCKKTNKQVKKKKIKIPTPNHRDETGGKKKKPFSIYILVQPVVKMFLRTAPEVSLTYLTKIY